MGFEDKKINKKEFFDSSEDNGDIEVLDSNREVSLEEEINPKEVVEEDKQKIKDVQDEIEKVEMIVDKQVEDQLPAAGETEDIFAKTKNAMDKLGAVANKDGFKFSLKDSWSRIKAAWKLGAANRGIFQRISDTIDNLDIYHEACEEKQNLYTEREIKSYRENILENVEGKRRKADKFRKIKRFILRK